MQAALVLSGILAAYWSITEQELALRLIMLQTAIFDGYYYFKLTFLFTWLANIAICLPIAFVLGWLYDRLRRL